MAAYVLGTKTAVKIGTVTYKTVGTPTPNFPPRKIDVRGGGDGAPVTQTSGLDNGAELTATLLSTDYSLLSLNGTSATVYLMDSSTTVLSFEAVLDIQSSHATEGRVEFNLKATPTEVPSQLTGITF